VQHAHSIPWTDDDFLAVVVAKKSEADSVVREDQTSSPHAPNHNFCVDVLTV
jgi:hypothetical protein